MRFYRGNRRRYTQVKWTVPKADDF